DGGLRPAQFAAPVRRGPALVEGLAARPAADHARRLEPGRDGQEQGAESQQKPAPFQGQKSLRHGHLLVMTSGGAPVASRGFWFALYRAARKPHWAWVRTTSEGSSSSSRRTGSASGSPSSSGGRVGWSSSMPK